MAPPLREADFEILDGSGVTELAALGTARIGGAQLGEHGRRVARVQFVQHRPLGGAPLAAAERLSGSAGRACVEATREHAGER